MDREGDWNNGLCSHVCGGDCGTCLGAWFCSCCLFGRTAQRLENFPDMEKPGLCDGNCWILGISTFCHLYWLPTCLKRGDVRKKFGIKGNGCSDCLASWCCFPCTLAQMETEVKDRAAAVQQSGPNQGYVSQQGGMAYEQPVQQVQQYPQYAQQQQGGAPPKY